MKYTSTLNYPMSIPNEQMKELIKFQTQKVFNEVASGMELDRWYAIRISAITRSPIGVAEFEKIITVEIDPAKENTIVYTTPEKIYLAQRHLPFMKKLKNCIAYLRDKDGGKWESEEASK